MSRGAAGAGVSGLRVLAALSVVAVLGCGGAPPSNTATRWADLGEVEHPDLQQVEPQLRASLAPSRERLERLLADYGASPNELAQAFGQLGERYHAVQLSGPADACYRNAEQLDREDPTWPAARGLLLLGGGQLEAAAASFGRALHLAPDDSALRLHLGDALLELGEAPTAEAEYQQVLDSGEEGFRAAALYGLGRAAAEQGENEIAIDRFRQVLDLAPKAGTARYALAQAYRRAGETDKAQELLAQGSRGVVTFPDPLGERIAAHATGPGVTSSRANQSLMAGDLDTAEKLFREVIAAAPDHLAARRNLAVTLRRQGRTQDAVSVLEQAIGIAPDDPNLLLDLAGARLAAGSAEIALSDYRRVVTAAPNLVTARFGLANALMSLGRWREAQPELERALELDPDHVRARYHLAMSLFQQGQRSAGMERLRRLIEELPDFTPAPLSLAAILTEGGDSATARATLERALSAGNPPPQLTHALAQLLATAADATVRDGLRALELARAAYVAQPSVDHAETMAMAMAESGDFDGAAEWQRGLVDQARSMGRTDLVERLSINLQRYEAGQPVRMRPPG